MNPIEIDFATDRDFAEKWSGCVVRTSVKVAPILHIERVRQSDEGQYSIVGTGYLRLPDGGWKNNSAITINYKDIQSGKIVFDPSFPEYGACSLTFPEAKGTTVLLSRLVSSGGIPKRGPYLQSNIAMALLDSVEGLLEDINVEHLDPMKIYYDALHRKYWEFGEAIEDLLCGNRISCALSSKITLKLSCNSPDIMIMFYNKPIGRVVGGVININSDKMAVWNTCKGDINGI